MNGKVEKYFDADAVDRERKLVLEVEAGRAIVNNQFLKDLFQACMMRDIDYLAIAVRKIYRGGNRQANDFEAAKVSSKHYMQARGLSFHLKVSS